LEAELAAAERSRFTPTQWSRLKSSIVNGYNSLAALQRKIAINERRLATLESYEEKMRNQGK
jgi:hypothetical protein